ncbi:MAG: DUF5309 family protein [Planctomycetota bacterium]
MAFTGKATYGAGADLPELVKDVSDIIGIVSPYETPLLDHVGDAKRSAQSTVHEWIEDELLANADAIDQTPFSPNPTSATSLTVDNGDRFRIGDLVQPAGSGEVMFVAAIVGQPDQRGAGLRRHDGCGACEQHGAEHPGQRRARG